MLLCILLVIHSLPQILAACPVLCCCRCRNDIPPCILIVLCPRMLHTASLPSSPFSTNPFLVSHSIHPPGRNPRLLISPFWTSIISPSLFYSRRRLASLLAPFPLPFQESSSHGVFPSFISNGRGVCAPVCLAAGVWGGREKNSVERKGVEWIRGGLERKSSV
jgi:hypothetical protein